MAASLVAPFGAAPASAALVQVGGPPQGPALVETGQVITALAAPGSTFQRLSTGLRADHTADAAEAVNTQLSPDGKTLLVETSGYNTNFKTETGTPILWPVLDPTTGAPTTTTTPKAEWVFVFDVTGATPRKVQQIDIPNTYVGLAWKPNGSGFYVSGGIDDRILVFKKGAGTQYVPDAPFILLGHDTNQTAPFPKYDGGILKGTPANNAALSLSGGKFGIATGAAAAGIGVSQDGTQIFVANLMNDSISYANAETRAIVGDTRFTTPGSGLARGEYPYDVAVLSDKNGRAKKVYVSSQRDGQVVVVNTKGVENVIPVGDGPNRLLLSHDDRTLFVSNGNTDSISVIDTRSDTVRRQFTLDRPGHPYPGSNPNWLALSPDGETLYVTLGGENAVAVVDVAEGRVLGRIPTGWQPNSVTVSADGKKLWVANAKAPAGPNPGNASAFNTAAGLATNSTFKNEYGWALEKGGLLQIPIPISRADLANTSYQVDQNDGFVPRRRDPILGVLAREIKHVIYIVNENRTYDQALGDLPGTNGAAALNLFPQKVSPNHHALQSDFTTFDNFYDPGESSGVGWNWTMEGYDTDFTERNQAVLYGNAGFNGITYDYQGINRNVNVAMPAGGAAGASLFNARITTLLDPSGASTILPGPKDVAAPFNANNELSEAIGGYIFDSALRAGKTIRNYGWQVDQTAYGSNTPLDPALIRYPGDPTKNTAHLLVPQAPPADAALANNTDIYYRGFDMRYPDVWRIEEWQREFDKYVANKNLPNLEVMTIPHDHFGSFKDPGTQENLVTPSRQYADNDYAIGKLVESVSNSPYWKDTAIFIVEDDSQSGADHVDSHRSFAYLVSAYTKRGYVDHTAYTTENMLATIEALLKVRPLSFFDANALPMTTALQGEAVLTPYTATVPGLLCGKPDDAPANPTIVAAPATPVSPDLVGTACSTGKVTAGITELHDGDWWGAQTAGYDFSRPDRIDTAAFNRLLWLGIKGDGAPSPALLGAAPDTVQASD